MELEQLGEPGGGELIEICEGLGEGLEPREALRVRGRAGREGLGVGDWEGPLPAGLAEEFSVLLEDLEALLLKRRVSFGMMRVGNKG